MFVLFVFSLRSRFCIASKLSEWFVKLSVAGDVTGNKILRQRIPVIGKRCASACVSVCVCAHTRAC